MLCHATALTASSIYIVLQLILLLQYISVLLVNVLTATNIAASKYLLLLELHLSHGKRHVDQKKRELREFVFFAFTSVAAAVP